MLEIRISTIRKAKASIRDEKANIRKKRKKSPIMEEYEGYLKKLERGKAIGFTLKEGDKCQTIKYRLNTAAKSLGIKNLKIERAGNKVICYKEVRPRTRKAAQYEAEVSPLHDESKEDQYLYEFEYQPEPEPESEPAGPDTSSTQSAFAATAAQDLTDIPPSAPPTEQEEELLAFDFDEEWEEPMVHGQKTCEARIERYASTNFEAFGYPFVITKAEQLTLGDISQKWFKQHGLFNPREFQEVWKQRHGGVFDPEQKAWLHHFRRGFDAPIEPDWDVYAEPEVQD